MQDFSRHVLHMMQYTNAVVTIASDSNRVFSFMRVRLAELIEERGMTLYEVAKAASGLGVSEQSIYRLARTNGKPHTFNMRVLAALCEVFRVEPGDLFEDDRKPRDKPKRK
jgi:DNA-binding Xre family transcriptional regulator